MHTATWTTAKFADADYSCILTKENIRACLSSADRKLMEADSYVDLNFLRTGSAVEEHSFERCPHRCVPYVVAVRFPQFDLKIGC